MEGYLSVITLLIGGLLLGAYFYLNGAAKPKPSPKKPSVPPVVVPPKNKQEDVIPEGFKPMTIIYASQSGNAQHFGEELAKEAKSYKFHAKAHDIEKYGFEAQLAKEKFVVFIVATYGEGDPTDSALDFDKWIMDETRDASELSGVEFCVFGLGNKQYEFFNKMGRKMDKRFEELGASRVFKRGEGDDDGSLEDDWNKWKADFWPEVGKHFFGADAVGKVELPKYSPAFRLVTRGVLSDEKEDAEIETPKAFRRRSSGFSHQKETADFVARVTVNRELRNMQGSPDKLKQTTSTVHIELDISDYPFSYRTADNLGIYPRNDYKLVARLAKRLGVDQHQEFCLKPLNEQTESNPYSEFETIQEALLRNVDINAYPRKKFLEIMAQFCSNAIEKAKLLELVSNSVAYQKVVVDGRKNVVDVLEDFPSVEMPLEVVLEVVGSLQPRYFTIASSNVVHPKSIHITVTVVEENVSGKVFNGVCSTYLKNLEAGKDSVKCFLRKSTFVLPSSPSTPVLMIGPGTGVAPMRAFVQEGTHLKTQGFSPKNWTLYFGCRFKEVDFIYQDEMLEALKEGVLSKLEVAFSRDQANKVYVQHLIQNQKQYVWEVVNNQGGYVYICGGTAMGRDVREIFIQICQEFGGMSEDKAGHFLRDLQQSGRFVQELWG